MHIPVLLHEAVEALQVQPEQWYIDGTFGRGGHTTEILAHQGKVIAFDCDAEAIQYGQTHFTQEIADHRLILIRANFDHLQSRIQELQLQQQITEVQGALFDFGISSPQLDDPTRGFSFQHDVELDMRMDDRLGVKAKDLLALLSEKQLAEIFFTYGGEREARKIARAVVQARAAQPITQVGQLLDIIESSKREKRGHLHPATKVFQALRIIVNGELDSIQAVLPQALSIIASPGRLVTISFHEGEDRVVKETFRAWEHQHQGHIVTKNVIVPTAAETDHNPRSRSAKMRVFEKTK